MREIETSVLEKAARKDTRSFDCIYNHYSGFVWKVIYKTVNGDFERAEQIMQDTFIKVWYSIGAYRFESAFSTWLYRIAYTTTLNNIRKSRGWFGRFRPIDHYTIPAAPQNAEYANDMVSKILSSLSPDMRFLLVAREIDGFSFEDLEEITGDKSGALRTRLSRLKENIRKEFKNDI